MKPKLSETPLVHEGAVVEVSWSPLNLMVL